MNKKILLPIIAMTLVFNTGCKEDIIKAIQENQAKTEKALADAKKDNSAMSDKLDALSGKVKGLDTAKLAISLDKALKDISKLSGKTDVEEIKDAIKALGGATNLDGIKEVADKLDESYVSNTEDFEEVISRLADLTSSTDTADIKSIVEDIKALVTPSDNDSDADKLVKKLIVAKIEEHELKILDDAAKKENQQTALAAKKVLEKAGITLAADVDVAKFKSLNDGNGKFDLKDFILTKSTAATCPVPAASGVINLETVKLTLTEVSKVVKAQEAKTTLKLIDKQKEKTAYDAAVVTNPNADKTTLETAEKNYKTENDKLIKFKEAEESIKLSLDAFEKYLAINEKYEAAKKVTKKALDDITKYADSKTTIKEVTEVEKTTEE